MTGGAPPQLRPLDQTWLQVVPKIKMKPKCQTRGFKRRSSQTDRWHQSVYHHCSIKKRELSRDDCLEKRATVVLGILQLMSRGRGTCAHLWAVRGLRPEGGIQYVMYKHWCWGDAWEHKHLFCLGPLRGETRDYRGETGGSAFKLWRYIMPFCLMSVGRASASCRNKHNNSCCSCQTVQPAGFNLGQYICMFSRHNSMSKSTATYTQPYHQTPSHTTVLTQNDNVSPSLWFKVKYLRVCNSSNICLSQSLVQTFMTPPGYTLMTLLM